MAEGIFGIGLDEVLRERVLGACQKESFLKKYYSEEERKLIRERFGCAATNFAGKEAVAKAFGTGFSGISPREIQILRRENGAPYVVLAGSAELFAREHGIGKIHISLSDAGEYASAYAVAVKCV